MKRDSTLCSNNSNSMNANVISHRQGNHNNHQDDGKEEILVDDDRAYPWFSSCLSLLLSRLIRCFVLGRGSSLLFFWLALLCGISTLSNLQRSFRTPIAENVNMNMNGNIELAVQQRQRLNRTNNVTFATQIPKTKIYKNHRDVAPSENREDHEPPTILIDPTSLKRGIDIFIRSNDYDTTATDDSNYHIWDLLENYQTYHTHTHTHTNRTYNNSSNNNLTDDDETPYYYYYYEQDEISSEIICGIGPGRGMEQDAGYKLLVEKIRIVEPDNEQQQQQEDASPKNKILCIVYTYSPMRYLVRTQAILWGRKCDGYIAFSNETIPELGIYKLPDEYLFYSGSTQESYNNMWQKTRGIWKYVNDHFVDEYDYFYLSGDDTYLLVNNFRSYLQNELSVLDKPSDPPRPRHFGSWLPSKSMIAGGPGYTLNKAALQRFFEATTTTNNKIGNNNSSNTSAVWDHCLSNKHQSYEDRFMSYCMSTFLGINGNDTDTRDLLTGEQRFHDTDPATLYLFRSSSASKGSYFSRMASSWEDQPMPKQQQQQQEDDNDIVPQVQAVVGPKHELDSAAKYSISLHRIYTPTYMARIHAILHHHHHSTKSSSTSMAICPIDTPLGKGLHRHYLH
jgi:glycoprotein-N-acetylgalactosamine 3-beta-galactosyltransferase